MIKCSKLNISLWENTEISEHKVLCNYKSQHKTKENNHFVEFTYGPLKRTRMDLEALTIQRGRDAGIANYNNARRAYGLEPIRTFADINPDLPAEVSVV